MPDDHPHREIMPVRKRVLLLGATGEMGRLLTREFLAADGLSVRTLLRTTTPRNLDAIKRLRRWRNLGLDIVPGDATNVGDMDEALRGIDIVVSALPADPVLRERVHQVLIEVMPSQSVRRLIPSNYCFDWQHASSFSPCPFAAREGLTERFRDHQIQVTHVLTGLATDSLFSTPQRPGLIEDGVLAYWGDDSQDLDLTVMRDTARFTTAAVLDDTAAGKTLCFGGDRRTIRGLASVLSRSTPHAVQAENGGTVEQLQTRISDQGRSYDDAKRGRLGVQWLISSGRAAFDRLDNERYPWIMPQSVGGFWSDQTRRTISSAVTPKVVPTLAAQPSPPAR